MNELNIADLNFGPEIGRGALGVVHQAFGPDGNTYAVKLLHPYLQTQQDAVALFEHEVETVTSLMQSPARQYVVPILASGQHEGTRCYVMPYLPTSLQKLTTTVADPKAADKAPKSVAEIFLAIAAAIDAVHKCGVVHGDLKPTNILLDDKRHVYLIDFGAARLLRGELGVSDVSFTGAAAQPPAGTVAYMAPEQFERGGGSKASDIYALSTIFWELIYGRLPYPLLSYEPLFGYVRRKAGEAPAPLPLRSGIPAPVHRVLLRGIERDPQLRYRTAGDLVHDILAAWQQPDAFRIKDPMPAPLYVLAGYLVVAALGYLAYLQAIQFLGR